MIQQQINIPKSWSDITVDQFKQLMTINPNDYESSSSILLEKLAIVTNTMADDEIWEDLSTKELASILKQSTWLNQPIKDKHQETILDGKFTLKPFIQLTLGEFIDLEYFIFNNLFENINKVIAILYRQTKNDDWGNVIYEPYSFDLNKRINLFDEIPITDVFNAIQDFIKWREDFLNKYAALFQPDFDDEELDDIEEIAKTDPELAKELLEDEKREKIQKKWGWERLLLQIANNDIKQITQVTELGLIYVFNMLAMKKELGIE